MDRDALRRQAQTSARASLELLASTFAGDAAAQDRIRRMLEEIDHLDQKPVVAAPESARGCGGSGSEVLVSAGGSSSNALESGGSSEKMLALDAQGASGHPARLDEPEPVGTLAASEASSSSSTLSAERASGSSAPDAKRQRRESAAALPTSLDQFPPHGCEVLIARRDGEPIYCAVVGHTPAGCLLVDVPGEAGPVERSVHGLRTGLGAEMRPLVRAKPEQWLQPRTEDLRTAEEQLEASALRRSEGRTREQLNAHLPSLPGLFACFGVPVVSAKGGAVSQLTFNIEQWNDLPQSESVPFEWWLGDGTNRLKAASLINPQEKEQPPGGLPLFFATKRKKGGALCAYGGHFTTGSFELLADAQRLRFKERDRQARIELIFHHFNEELAQAVNRIPAEPS